MSYEKILELDNELLLIIEEYVPKILKLNKESHIPKTGSVLLLFISKTNFIKEGIYALYESENIYAINILFRSLIEHSLKFYYILFRFLLDKNDDIGNEYLEFCSLSEGIYESKAWKDVTIALERDLGLDPYETLRKINIKYKKYTKTEIIKKSEQFQYKKIIYYINKHINKNMKYEDNKFLLSIIPEYVNLSSFVHGGVAAEGIMMKFVGDKDRKNELLKKIELTYKMTGSIKLFSFLILSQYDKNFSKAYIKIDQILKKYPDKD